MLNLNYDIVSHNYEIVSHKYEIESHIYDLQDPNFFLTVVEMGFYSL